MELGLPPLDNAGTEVRNTYIDTAGAVERSYTTPVRRIYWTGRVHNEPTPTIPNTPQIHYTDLFGPVEVPEWNARGALNLFIRYLSPTVPDTAYFYDAAKRHSLPLNMQDPSRPWFGSDMDFDSFAGFSGKLGLWTFRVLAEKDILAVVHSGTYGDRSAWCAPRDGTHGFAAAFPCVAWEKRRVWVVEGVPTGYSQYAYVKRIFYIDQDFFGLVLTELYDPQGEFWRFFLPCYFFTTQPYAGYPTHPIEGGSYDTTEERPFIPNTLWVDVQEVFAFAQDSPSGLCNAC